MNRRVLIVDDELNLLRSFQRNLRGKYDLTTAEGGVAGIAQILESGPFGVIVSDFRMPEIDGLQVLGMARIVMPDTYRVMLTGNVDSHLAVQDTNNKPWFQYINKPCSTDRLCAKLNEGLDRYEMSISARRQKTQSIQEEGSPRSPQTTHGPAVRCQRLRQLAGNLGILMNLNEIGQLQLAGMLSQLSRFVSVADSEPTLQVNVHDESFRRKQAESSSKFIREIPRLEQIADMVAHQYTEEFESTVPDNVRNGARILRMLTEFDILTETLSDSEAISQMKKYSHGYGESLLKYFSESILSEPTQQASKPRSPNQLSICSRM